MDNPFTRGFYYIRWVETSAWEIALWHNTPSVGWHWSVAGSDGIITTVYDRKPEPIPLPKD